MPLLSELVGKRMFFNIRQMEDKRIFQTSYMKDMKKRWWQKKLHFWTYSLVDLDLLWLMGVLQANPACQAVLSSSEECLDMHLHLLLLSSLSGALWVRMVLCASQKPGYWVQTQGLCWGRADEACWTWAESVQADIAVVNYTVCLAACLDFFLFHNHMTA